MAELQQKCSSAVEQHGAVEKESDLELNPGEQLGAERNYGAEPSVGVELSNCEKPGFCIEPSCGTELSSALEQHFGKEHSGQEPYCCEVLRVETGSEVKEDINTEPKYEEEVS